MYRLGFGVKGGGTEGMGCGTWSVGGLVRLKGWRWDVRCRCGM